MTVTFWDDTYNLQTVVDEVSRIGQEARRLTAH